MMNDEYRIIEEGIRDLCGRTIIRVPVSVEQCPEPPASCIALARPKRVDKEIPTDGGGIRGNHGLGEIFQMFRITQKNQMACYYYYFL